MKFGTGSTTELTQKCEGQSTKMPCVRPNIFINKYPRFSIELPLIVSRSLCSLANYLAYDLIYSYHLLLLLCVPEARVGRYWVIPITVRYYKINCGMSN